MLGTLRRLGGRVIRLGAWKPKAPPPPPVPPPPPTVFHITHQKAGSQWINRILHILAYDRMVQPEFEEADTHDLPVEGTQFLRRPVEPGRIYPTLYLTREQFAAVPVPPVVVPPPVAPGGAQALPLLPAKPVPPPVAPGM